MARRQGPQTRAKDSDRNDTCQLLDNALADGQLSAEEHRRRVADAVKAVTLGDLHHLVTDLQAANPPLQPRRERRSWKVQAAVAGVIAVVGGAVGWGIYNAASSPPPASDAPSAQPAAEPPAPPKTADAPTPSPEEAAPTVLTVPRELHTVAGMTGLLDQIRSRFGDTVDIELAITPDAAMLFRADPTDDQSKLLYRFNGGWGDPTRKPRDDKDTPADLGAFDVPAVAEVIRRAPETLGIAAADVSETFVDVDHIAEPAGPGALELLVMVETTSGDRGFIYLDSAGSTKRVENPG